MIRKINTNSAVLMFFIMIFTFFLPFGALRAAAMRDSTNVVNGLEVAWIDYGIDGKKVGAYFQTGPTLWKELDRQNNVIAELSETKRDQSAVYLEGPSRMVKIQINMKTEKVRYSDSNTPVQDKYDVLQSAPVNGWTLAEAKFGSLDGDNTQLGSYFQTGEQSWHERNAEGKKVVEFMETGRDDWSVYLQDSSSDEWIQIDIWEGKVIYHAPDTSARDQYELLQPWSEAAPVNP